MKDADDCRVSTTSRKYNLRSIVYESDLFEDEMGILKLSEGDIGDVELLQGLRLIRVC